MEPKLTRSLPRKALPLIEVRQPPRQGAGSPSVQRYYFHDGSPDATGMDLPDDASARALACEALAERIRETQVAAPGSTFNLRVTDGMGRPVIALTFLATI